ncbi:aminotransferase class V-fold PLP-dependent enzyme, partial [bacterium]
MDRSHYFDNAATTPIDPRVLDAMRPWLEEDWANADSIHSAGLKARAAVEEARLAVMELIGAEDPHQIVFTSGATESANAVIASVAEGWFSPFEHAAVREPALARGWKMVPNEAYQVSQPEGFGALMAVNNETGAIFPPCEGLIDATQALGKLPFSVGEARYAIGSAHKIYGPKGVGFVYCEDGELPAWTRGGEQEGGRRAGTLNVAGIVGLGAAAALAIDGLDGAPI